MKRAAILAVVACGSADEADPCLTKLAALNQPGATEACTGVDAVSRAFRACVIAAVDTPGVAACLEPLREAKAPHDAGAPAPVADAAAPVAPPLDVTKLPELPVPASTKKGDPTEVFAVDAPADALIVQLADRRWLLMPSGTQKITGHMAAPSRAAAADALGAKDEPPPKGRGVTVELTFWAAPQRDIFHLLGDVMRTSVVVPGDLPAVDIVARRIPADGVMAALAKLDGRTIVRHGNVNYLLPAGDKLPPLPKLSGNDKVSLRVRDGTAADAMAALRAVTALPIGACGTTKITVMVNKVKPAEAARAIAVAAGVPLDDVDRCPIADAPSPDVTGARVVATASAGTRRSSVIVRGTTSSVIHELASFPAGPEPERLADWLATLARTSAVIHSGATWSALFETKTGETTSPEAARARYGLELDRPPEIDARGVTVNGVRVPLRRL